MNVIILSGRLTADPELKTARERLVTAFTVAVDRSFSNSKDYNNVDFIHCVAWRKTAEFITKHFKKGQEISIRGELHQDKWKDKDGNQHSLYNVVVRQAEFGGLKFYDKKDDKKDGEPVPQIKEKETEEDIIDFYDRLIEEDVPFL